MRRPQSKLVEIFRGKVGTKRGVLIGLSHWRTSVAHLVFDIPVGQIAKMLLKHICAQRINATDTS
jgi:hypothetical protein